jgi:hypothetical protein
LGNRRPVKNNRTGHLDQYLDPASVYRNIVRKYGLETGIGQPTSRAEGCVGIGPLPRRVSPIFALGAGDPPPRPSTEITLVKYPAAGRGQSPARRQPPCRFKPAIRAFVPAATASPMMFDR